MRVQPLSILRRTTQFGCDQGGSNLTEKQHSIDAPWHWAAQVYPEVQSESGSHRSALAVVVYEGVASRSLIAVLRSEGNASQTEARSSFAIGSSNCIDWLTVSFSFRSSDPNVDRARRVSPALSTISW